MFELSGNDGNGLSLKLYGLGKQGNKIAQYIESRGVEGLQISLNEEEAMVFDPMTRSGQGSEARVFNLKEDSGFSMHTALDMVILVGDQNEVLSARHLIERMLSDDSLVYVLLMNNQQPRVAWPVQLKELESKIDLLIPLPWVLSSGGITRPLFNQNEAALWFLRGICEILAITSLICVDFADVRGVTHQAGIAISLYTIPARGEARAHTALKHLETQYKPYSKSCGRPKNCCINIYGGRDLSIDEFDFIGSGIEELMGYGGTKVVGTTIIPDLGDSLRITALFCDFEINPTKKF